MDDKMKIGEILVRKLKGHQLQIQARQKFLEKEMEKERQKGVRRSQVKTSMRAFLRQWAFQSKKCIAS
jgi:hypothetical protein